MPRRPPHQPASASSKRFNLSPQGLGRSGAQLVALGMVVLSLWMLASFVGQIITSAQLERRREGLEAEIAKLESENTKLEADVAYAESPAYAERIAREQLGYAREGDTVVLPTFPELTPIAAVPAAPPIPAPITRSNLGGWAAALFPAAESP